MVVAVVGVRPGITVIGVVILSAGVLLIAASPFARTTTMSTQPVYNDTQQPPYNNTFALLDTIIVQPHTYYNYSLTLDANLTSSGGPLEVGGWYTVSGGDIGLFVFPRSEFEVWSQNGSANAVWNQSYPMSRGEFYFSQGWPSITYDYVLVFDNIHTTQPDLVKTVAIGVDSSPLYNPRGQVEYATTEMVMWAGAPILGLGVITSISGFIITLIGIVSKPITAAGFQPGYQYPTYSGWAGLKACPYCKTENNPDALFCTTCGERLP